VGALEAGGPGAAAANLLLVGEPDGAAVPVKEVADEGEEDEEEDADDDANSDVLVRDISPCQAAGDEGLEDGEEAAKVSGRGVMMQLSGTMWEDVG